MGRRYTRTRRRAVDQSSTVISAGSGERLFSGTKVSFWLLPTKLCSSTSLNRQPDIAPGLIFVRVGCLDDAALIKPFAEICQCHGPPVVLLCFPFFVRLAPVMVEINWHLWIFSPQHSLRIGYEAFSHVSARFHFHSTTWTRRLFF